MHQHEKINYVEFPARDLEKAKAFFTAVFNWSFTDFGPEYTAFVNEGLDGGFFKSDNVVSVSSGSALIVFFSESLDQTLAKVEANGGEIIQAIVDFPGGRRFHFTDPNGNEYAVWSNK